MKNYTHLTREQRYQIYVLRKTGHSQTDIADLLKVHKSTISRELRRNTGGRGYRPKQAHRKAIERRMDKVPRRIAQTEWYFVERLLREDWSPEQVSNWLNQNYGINVSHERIYQHILEDKSHGGTLYTHLRCRRKRRKRYGVYERRGEIHGKLSIEQRPSIVEEKARFGDWEVDTVIGKGNKQAIVSLIERKSYLTLIRKVERKTAVLVTKAVIEMLKPISHLVHTITSDNGKEFAGHAEISEILGAEFYFAHPYASWERGINENTNGLIRQYVPKSRMLESVDDIEIQNIMQKLNNRPRKATGYKTPNQILFSIDPVALAS
ncbi:IS30 family transposase [Limisalsivibrio acetivorans]|uniref:IS30 family transposase n=1 Tax=Limisalsivibrio acetivorans TaxID=1304888 RepID=UPI0003B3AF81|nr:IS30 family transposase [Limisalsivibrio acetivorans]